MDPKTLDIVKQTTLELFKHLKIDSPEIILEADQENNVVNLNLQTPDSGILIGYHGQTLDSLQLILALMVYQQTKIWTRIVLEIGDYRSQRKRQLEEMASRVAEKVKYSQEPSTLTNLNSSERRIVHLYLADDPEVITESIGEARSRQLVIRPAN